MSKFLKFFAKCDLNNPVDEVILETYGKELVGSLPENYLEFLRFSNGVEGEVSNGSYLQLWKIEELKELNQKYEVEKYAPGMFLIGSDGGDEAIGIDTRKESKTHGSFYKIPFIPLDWKESVVLGPQITDINIIG